MEAQVLYKVQEVYKNTNSQVKLAPGQYHYPFQFKVWKDLQ